MNNNLEDLIDKNYTCCATCRYWCGIRKYDGIGLIRYNSRNDYGTCGNDITKGFSGKEMRAYEYCGDYEQMVK